MPELHNHHILVRLTATQRAMFNAIREDMTTLYRAEPTNQDVMRRLVCDEFERRKLGKRIPKKSHQPS